MNRAWAVLLIISTSWAADNPPEAMADMMRMMMNMMMIMMQNKEVPPLPAIPTSAPPICRPLQLNDIQGEWQNETQVKIAVKQKYARFYFGNQYRNFFVQVLPPRLRLTQAETGQVQEFELQMPDPQSLILKDSSGRTTRFKRIRSFKEPADQ